MANNLIISSFQYHAFPSQILILKMHNFLFGINTVSLKLRYNFVAKFVGKVKRCALVMAMIIKNKNVESSLK